MRRARLASVVACALALGGCRKAPLHDVDARFLLADATWFEAEQTLFVFYEVEAEQGIGEDSVVEITYATDEERVDWTEVSELVPVHTHVEVDCGYAARCGSVSVRVPVQPREVDVRMRYHRDGELALGSVPVFNVVDTGPAHTHRSLVVYGVFDASNERVQWRARHQFPTLRNHQVEALGLRRTFAVEEQQYGSGSLASPSNPYGYGVSCPDAYVQAGMADVQTSDRAVFGPDPIPLGASAATTLCAQATVTDATGPFTTGAIARKNPEVQPAFPELRSPIHDATPLRFFLGPCERTISEAHEQMQRQRLQLEGVPTTCTDDWDEPGFVDELVVTFRDAVEAQRPYGDDMVLVVAVHREDPGVAEAVEEALLQVVPAERHFSTPRLAGAFVLDSDGRGLTVDELSPVTLWCPTTVSLEELPDLSSRTCAIAPESLTLELGPFTIGEIPILPSREQYLDFLDSFTEAQAGHVEDLGFRVPEFAATSDHVDLGPFGVVTFLNNEQISAEPGDAFSFCADNDPTLVMFRSDLMQGPPPPDVICDQLGLGEELCESAKLGIAPLEIVGDWHATFGERSYELGVFWEFPFLLQMDYELVAAGSLTAFGFTVPFGFAEPAEALYGSETWTRETHDLSDDLLQCQRFCDHPTFDSAGVYHPTDPFRSTYARRCYLPRYPEPTDSGFPLDP